MTERLQNYYDEGLKVYRTGQVDPATPSKPPGKPRLVCKAVSRRQAQLVSAALNFYLPKNERRAMKRDTLHKADPNRLDRIRKSFGTKIEQSARILRNSGGEK